MALETAQRTALSSQGFESALTICCIRVAVKQMQAPPSAALLDMAFASALMTHTLQGSSQRTTASAVQAIRLIAGVIAKNAVGSSWRKTLGSREWSKVPDQEKAAVRSAAARLLLSEDSHRVSVQLGLLITNIARYAGAGQSAESPSAHCWAL